jgi:hypothetical protein
MPSGMEVDPRRSRDYNNHVIPLFATASSRLLWQGEIKPLTQGANAGPPQSCDLNGCAGAFNGIEVQPQCTGASLRPPESYGCPGAHPLYQGILWVATVALRRTPAALGRAATSTDAEEASLRPKCSPHARAISQAVSVMRQPTPAAHRRAVI